MKKLSFIVIVLCGFCGFGQQTKTISEKEFEKLRDKIEELATMNPDSAYVLSQNLIKIATQNNSARQINNALITTAYIKSWQSKEDEAFLLIQKCLQQNVKLNDQPEKAKIYFLFGKIYQNKADFVNATKYFLKALNSAEKFKNYKLIQKIYRSLSTINIPQENFEKSLFYIQKAVYFEKKEPNNADKANNFNCLANCYLNLQKYDLAEKCFKKSYELYKIEKNDFRKAWVLTEYSTMFDETDKIKELNLELEAQETFNKIAKENLVSIDNIGNIGICLFDIAKNDSLIRELKKKNNKIIPNTKDELLVLSEKYLRECFEKNKSKKRFFVAYYVNDVLSDLQYYKGDYKNAYDNLLLSKKISDSIFSQKNKNAIAKLESEKEVMQLKTQNEKKATWNKILIGSSFGLIFLGFIGYRFFRTRQKLQNLKISELEKDKQLLAIDAMMKGQEEERSRIAKDLHDGLGGLLSGTKLSFTTMKENLILTPENAVQFDKSLSMLDTTMNDLRKVAHNLMPEALVKFGLNEALKDFCSSIESTKKVNVVYQKLGTNEKYENTTEVFIYRIIQELVNNALKHAQAKEVLVQLATHKNSVHITVEDDGIGYDTNSIQNKKGNGLANIEYRVNYLNGAIDTVSSPNNGTAVNIDFKI
jgi:two-component system, NarL family, sensor kinase